MKLDETPRFWYPRVTRDAWIDFAFCSNENLRSDFHKSYREARVSHSTFSLFLTFSPPSTHRPFFFCFAQNGPFFTFLYFSFFLSFFFFLFFPLFYLFLSFSLFFFSFGSYPTELSCCSTLIPFKFSFFFFFFIIPFDFLSFIFPFDTWLNMSQLSKCYVSLVTPHGYHAMYSSPKVSCGIHMLMPCITRCLEKCEISTVSESDEIRRGN